MEQLINIGLPLICVAGACVFGSLVYTQDHYVNKDAFVELKDSVKDTRDMVKDIHSHLLSK